MDAPPRRGPGGGGEFVKPANASHALATAIVDELVRCGVTDVALAPGSRSAPLAMAGVAHARIRTHVVLDERSASFLALGIAKATGRATAVLSTSGTAAANFHPAVCEADLAGVPLVVVTADRPPELRATGANQTIDQVHLYGGAVRFFADVGPPEVRADSAAYWRSLTGRAIAAAEGSPPGPVHINVSFREPLVPVPDAEGWPYDVDGRASGDPWARTVRGSAAARGEDVDHLAERIAASERGLVVAGEGRFEHAEPLLALARRAAYPVLAEPLSGLRTGEEAISTYDGLLRHARFADSHRPDLVLRVGHLGLSKRLAAWLDDDIPQVLIDPHGRWLDPNRRISMLMRADPGVVAGQILKRVDERGDSGWWSSWRRAEARARAAVDELLDASDAPSEPRTARDLAAAVLAGGTLVVASSMPVRDLDYFMAPRSGLRVLANRGASGIDGFVSTALGVSLASEGPTYALAGDLSLLHDQNGLTLLGSERVDLVIVVVNNDGGGIFSFLPQAEFDDVFEKLFGTPHGIDLAGLAALYGCGHARVQRASDLVPLVDDARKKGGVNIVEVRTDRRENVEVHRRLTAAVVDALDSD
jgi:2-succinyl-5-enolpyruvyl-6-hydroxy-3-cyclohexene-1-carboxylate synthase